MKKICVTGLGLPSGAIASALSSIAINMYDPRQSQKKQEKKQARESQLRQKRLDKLNNKKSKK